MEIKEHIIIIKDLPLFINAKLILSTFNNEKFKKVSNENLFSICSIIKLEFNSNEKKNEFLKKYQNFKLKNFNM